MTRAVGKADQWKWKQKYEGAWLDIFLSSILTKLLIGVWE